MYRTMTRLCLLCLLILAPFLVSHASAQTANEAVVTAKLSWVPPATRENGEPLTDAEIQGYEILVTDAAGEPLETIGIGRNADGTLPESYAHNKAYPISPDKVTAIYQIRTQDTYGNYSRWSEPVIYGAVVAPPNYSPPGQNSMSLGVECQECTLLERK